jgi:type 1 glutamine amidotransferase
MKMANVALIIAAAGVSLTSLLCMAEKPASGKKKILVYSQSFGFRHSVVRRPLSGELSHAEKILKDILTDAGYEVYLTQDFNDLKGKDDAKKYDAIILYTTGNPLINREGLLQWLRDGGALMGIHTATDTYHHDAGYGKAWPEYTRIMGGAFRTHGGNHLPIVLKFEDPSNPAVKVLGDQWSIADEIYQFDPKRFSRDNVHVIMSVDTEKMGDEALKLHKMEKGGDYPIAWTNTEGKGRVFYTSLGHREDVWTNPKYQKHVLAGIAWALGEK